MRWSKVKEAATGPLAWKTWVLTGTLDSMTRDEAEARLRTLGTKLTDSVSAHTKYLVAEKAPGFKLDRARRVGVPVLAEADFLKLVNPLPGSNQ
ncbi:MAG: BRCT domain-containing protein [Acidobacteriota bacterium]|jgi:DNA ligase (NAD+)